eukprot:9996379-Heterocapsa_arctica.AAC.1
MDGVPGDRHGVRAYGPRAADPSPVGPSGRTAWPRRRRGAHGAPRRPDDPVQGRRVLPRQG